MDFRQKIIFKSVLESFASFGGHLRTCSLKILNKSNRVSVFSFFASLYISRTPPHTHTHTPHFQSLNLVKNSSTNARY